MFSKRACIFVKEIKVSNRSVRGLVFFRTCDIWVAQDGYLLQTILFPSKQAVLYLQGRMI